MDFIQEYNQTVLVIGLTSFLFLIQLVIADVAGILKKKTPGFSINENHDEFLFRSHRALANSNESAAIFILAVLFAMFSFASPKWVNIVCLGYFLGRTGHMLCYFYNLKLLRSIFFGVSLISIGLLLILGMTTFFENQ